MKTRLQTKIAALVSVLIIGWSFHGTAQTQTVTLTVNQSQQTQSYPLLTNQIVKLISITGGLISFTGVPGYYSGPPYVDLENPAGTVRTTNVGTFTGLTGLVVSMGVASYQYGGGGGSTADPGIVTFEVCTPPPPGIVVSNYVPADAIVIPASATGNVQIILESSPDLVNWTAASPGTYGASAGTNRFFRVRAVAN